MLPPQTNTHRTAIRLDGLWKLRIEREGDDSSSWPNGFQGDRIAAVPGSFNEQFTDYETFNHMGRVWYEREFEVPANSGDKTRWFLHFAAVNYAAEVYVDGQEIGSHATGYTPFECPLPVHLAPGPHRLVVRVDCALTPNTVPQGGFDKAAIPGLSSPFHPSVNFDFFPYSGILRPVTLCSTAEASLDSLRIEAAPHDESATVRVLASAKGVADILRFRVEETGEGGECVAGEAIKFSMAEPKLWDLWQPYLYHLIVEVVVAGRVVDSYRQSFGVRRVEVVGDQILLNGLAVYLKGFGRHEDFPVVGRGLVEAVNVRDMELLRWIGGNSFRTAHYPHAEEMLDLADRLGVLVIAESPAVSMIP